MKLENFLIGIGLFSVFIIIFVGASANIVSNYADMGITIPFNNVSIAVYDKAEQINQQASEMQESLTNIPSGPLSAITGFIAAAWSTVISTLSGISLITAIIEAVADSLHIPASVVGFIISALTITLIILIAKMVFNVSTGE